MLKNFYSSYEQVKRSSERSLSLNCVHYICLTNELYCLEPGVLATVADRKFARCTVSFAS